MKPPKKRTPKAAKKAAPQQPADVTWADPQPARASGRSLSDFEPVMTAERTLLQACRIGEIAVISEQRPQQATEENTVRAGFLRFLLLGGDHSTPVHEQGVQLQGAWIAGELDLENTATVSAIDCVACTFTEPLILVRSTLPGGLFLVGSEVPGIEGDRLVTSGGVYLRDNFKATGEVRLVGAQIGGNLDCSNGQFDGRESSALSADGADIKGSVFLKDRFQAMGEVRLLGAQIGGSLNCNKGLFDGSEGNALSADGVVIKLGVFLVNGFQATGTVRLVSAQIGSDLVCIEGQFDSKEGRALDASHMRVAGVFFFRNLSSPVSRVSLAATSVGVLADDADAWGGDLVLDGFTYGSISGGAPTTATARLAWLDKQRPAMSGQSGAGSDFCPQPWKQLQKVLREMGHAEDARQVAIALEDRLRHADLIGLSPQHWSRGRKWLYRASARSFHLAFRILTGYGYRPIRLLGWFTAIWLACAAFYWFAALPPRNVFAPSNPLVFQNEDYAKCVPGSRAAMAEQAKPADAKPSPVKGAGNWYLCETLPQEYTGFSPLAYSLDVILPLVDLQQQKDWSPMIPTPKPSPWNEWRGSGWKHITRMVLWAETLFGWLASLLLVAIVSGLTKRREE